MVARPIRLDLLCHEVIYTAPGEKDRWGEDVYVAPVTVKRVRIEPNNSIDINSNGENVTHPSTLFWDAIHSTPCDFKPDGFIEWGEKKMYIKSVKPYFDRSKLHHIEVTVI